MKIGSLHCETGAGLDSYLRDAQLHPPLQVERPELPPAVRRRAVESGDVT